MGPCKCTCMHTAHAGVATDKSQAPVAKKRAAVPSRAPGPPSASAGAPQPPQPAQPSATELRAASGDGRCLGSVPRVPLTKEQALQQAHAEGLTLRKVDNKSGYANVSVDTRGRAKPYMAQLKRRGSTDVSLGSFATAEEAALCVARSPEGRAAAAAAEQAAAAADKRAAAAAAKRAAASEEGQGTSEEVIEVDE